jgi:hypothetical protein
MNSTSACRTISVFAGHALLALHQHVVRSETRPGNLRGNHGAQADAGRYHKILLPTVALAEIHKIMSEARQEYYLMTLPWDDNGYRVLPAAAYMNHTEKMRALSNRFTPAVEALGHHAIFG